jgi:hypothetical protein
MTAELPESKVLQIWQDCAGRDDLATEEEGAVKVLYQGRLNDSSGADFRDAVIQTGQGLLTGDIEIHTKTSNWWTHRHHLDPLYNRVILHVVLRHDVRRSVTLENGRSVPTLALHKFFDGHSPLHASIMPCNRTGKIQDIKYLLNILEEAGEKRFQSRAAGYQAVSSPEEAGQALYRGIMAALGYAQNKHQMTELASRMPLHRLESLVTAEMPDTECLARFQAMLSGTAGLLPSQRTRHCTDAIDEIRFNRLEELWETAGETVTMSEKDWQFFRVRPVNYPTRRIAAMGRLLLRYRTAGLLDGLIRKFEAITENAGRQELEDMFTIESGESGHNVSLLGKDRADLIIVNVLLPFASAWGRINSLSELVLKAENIYRRYPPPAANTLERHMSRQLGIDSALIDNACRQQGLLHIFKSYCVLGACRECPLRQVD